jgi:hypothetical protein
MLDSATLDSSEGLAVEAGPVRVAERGEMSWRILAKDAGRQSVWLTVGDRRLEKGVVVSTTARGASPRRMRASLASLFLAPAEPAIDDGGIVEQIVVDYPPLEIDFLGWKAPWIVVFLVVSSAVALALRRRVGVEF